MNQTSRPNKPDEWIEQYASGNPGFGKRIPITISRNGLGVDQIMFRFTLPELPERLKYKKFCAYDLIKNICLEIGGTTIFQLNSKQLYMFDQVERNFYDIQKCSATTNNKILYPIDLKYFFKESKSDDINLSSNLIPMDFKGIRLIDLDHHEVRLYITINSTDNIIDNSGHFPSINNYKDILSKLELVDFDLLVHYVGIYNENLINYITIKNMEIKSQDNNTQNYSIFNWLPNPLSLFYTPQTDIQQQTVSIANTVKSPKLKQNIRTWICDSWEINDKDRPISNLKYKMYTPNKKSSKIIFHSEMLNKIKFFNLQLDGYDYMSKINVKEYKTVYEYNNNITLDDSIFVFNAEIMPTVKNVVFCMWFSEPCDNLSIDFMFDENGDSTIEGGMFIK
jgi:hypothetical protein